MISAGITTVGNCIRRYRSTKASIFLSAALLAGFPGTMGVTYAQAVKRCDLALKSTPGAAADPACLDLVSVLNGGAPIQTAGNATRISRDGFRICKNAFQVQTSAEADIVFIFDNSGSMFANSAWIDSAANDTTYYNINNGCRSQDTLGSFMMQNANSPLLVRKLKSNTGCSGYAGDPYEVRAQVIKSAIDYMAATSPTSTAGVTGFAEFTGHALPPVQLNTPANVKQVKDSAIIDSIGHTYYGPPLKLATDWLKNPALTKTNKHAIVFISDGAPEDGAGRNGYLGSVDTTIPIHSIFLGQVVTRDTANLKQLSDMTHGTFTRVNPRNIAAINQVMQGIIQSLIISTLPRSIEVANASFAPPQDSRSVNLARGADSSISVALDSILGLKQGLNDLRIKIVMNDTLTRSYAVKVQADGPAAAASTSSLTCYDPPALSLVNAQGKPDSVYPSGSTDYQVRLTRASDDLANAVVTAISKDSTQVQPWGDAESLKLNPSGAAGTVLQGPITLNGNATGPAAGNGTLESTPNGKVILNWVHPRDPREFATYELPGTKVPTVTPFIQVERVHDVAKGSDIDKPIADPVVIFGGATLTRAAGDSAGITHGGCIYNCTGDAALFAERGNNPGFIFKTASPFSYVVKIYDHLGNFVNTSAGTVDAVKWQAMPKKGDSVAVIMNILPVARNGNLIGTGVYILRATINSQAADSRDAQGKEIKVAADSKSFVNRFGYLREKHH